MRAIGRRIDVVRGRRRIVDLTRFGVRPEEALESPGHSSAGRCCDDRCLRWQSCPVASNHNNDIPTLADLGAILLRL